PKQPWNTDVIDDTMHVTHNLDVVQWDNDPEEEILIGGKEGIILCDPAGAGWNKTKISESGTGELRLGHAPGNKKFIAAIEPFHGTKLDVHTPIDGDEKKLWPRTQIDESFKEGHALACADLAGIGCDQIVAGWRIPNAGGKVGINIYVSTDG